MLCWKHRALSDYLRGWMAGGRTEEAGMKMCECFFRVPVLFIRAVVYFLRFRIRVPVWAWPFFFFFLYSGFYLALSEASLASKHLRVLI